MAAPLSVQYSLPLNGSWSLLVTPAAGKNAQIQVATPGIMIEWALAAATADLAGLAGHILSSKDNKPHSLTAPATGICARNLGGGVTTVQTKVTVTVTV